MENFKGTPGPWIIPEGRDNIIKDSKGNHIATVWGAEDIVSEEAKANTKVMSMSLELLEAIDRINKIVYANVIKVGSPDYHEIRNLCDHLIQKATE